MKKKRLVLALIVALALLFVACGGAGGGSGSTGSAGTGDNAASTGGGAAGDNVLTIGICEPMTGGMAASGEYSVAGATMAVNEINEAGGVDIGGTTYTFELAIQDSEGKTDVTINAYNKLIGDDKVIAIIGTNTSGTSMAGGPIATEAKVPAISPTGTNPDVTVVGGEYVFRTCMTDDYQGKLCARLAWETLECTKGAVLYNNSDDFSVGIMDLFVESFEELGGEVLSVSYAGADVKDFRAQLTQIQEYDGEFLFIPAQSNEIPLIIQQIREMNLDIQVIGDSSWGVNTVPEIAGEDIVEGCYFLTTFSPDSTDPKVIEHVEVFEAEYGYIPNAISVMNYSGVYIIKQALENCGTVSDPEAFRDAIANIDIDLLIGHLTYDENRNPANPTGYIMQYQAGKAVYVTTMS